MMSILLGDYQFALSADDTGELWLSTDSDPKNIRLIASLGKVLIDTDFYK